MALLIFSFYNLNLEIKLTTACHTIKFLVWIIPNDNVARIFTVYPGSTSDKELFVASGWVNLLNAGDRVLAYKGFLLADLLPEG